jgi:uncharacterized alpha-E superfamily protein
MISRVAEHCFWLQRYVERVENTARLLQVNVAFLLDTELPLLDQWRPLVVVAGEEKRFRDLVGRAAMDDGEATQDYLVWDARCPVSIATTLGLAREGARTARDAISAEMWTALNDFTLWMRGPAARRLYQRERQAFYERVKDACHLFQGVTASTMLYAEAFGFLRLGTLLERAGWTARILDLPYHAAGAKRAQRETPAQLAQWLAILRACSGSDAFLRSSHNAVTGHATAEFLLFDETFPRAMLHCLVRAQSFVARLRSPDRPEIGAGTAQRLDALVDHMREVARDGTLPRRLHAELTRLIDGVTDVGDAVRSDYFDPTTHSLIPLA